MGKLSGLGKLGACGEIPSLASLPTMSEQWFYLSGEEQVGPYPGEQLHELVSGNFIQRETLLWTEGMTEWLPAEQIENLFPSAEPEPEVAAASGSPLLLTAAPSPAQPVAQPAQEQGAVAETAYPPLTVKRASFTLHLVFGVYIPVTMGLICLILFLISGQQGEASESGEISDGLATALGLAVLLFIATLYLCPLVAAIIGYVHLYRAWQILQPGGPRTSPGSAVGLMFIPFFNLYWVFVAYHGLAHDWNHLMGRWSDTKGVPRFSNGIFLTYCICLCSFFLIPLAPIFYFMAHGQICRGINFMANRPKPGSAGASGGLRLY